MTVLATVRNTGTQFTAALLEQHLVRHNGLYEPPEGGDLWISHTETDKMHRIREKCEQDGPLILTMRHPVNVAQSWIKRGKQISGWFCEMWENLFSLKAEFEDSFWLPIDTEDRDHRLALIGERLGISLDTDWTPKGVTGNNWPYIEGMTVTEAAAYLRTLPFEQFGYVIDGSNYGTNS